MGFDEILEGAPAGATVRAEERAICLELREEDFLGLLSENVDLVQGVFRMLLDRASGSIWKSVVRGSVTRPAVARLSDGLQAIDKLLIVEEMPVFHRASAGDLTALASIVREAPLTAGEALFQESDVPAIYVLLSGRL